MTDFEKYAKHFGKLVYDARKKGRLTQEKIGERVGVNQRTILEIEKGRDNPKMDLLIALILELNINPLAMVDLKQESSPIKDQLLYEISTCTAREAEILYSVCHNVIQTLRTDEYE